MEGFHKVEMKKDVVYEDNTANPHKFYNLFKSAVANFSHQDDPNLKKPVNAYLNQALTDNVAPRVMHFKRENATTHMTEGEAGFKLDDVNINQQILSSIIKSVQSMPGLIKLTLVNTLLMDSAADNLLYACNLELSELDLSKNRGLTKYTYCKISDRFRKLKKLTLENNDITDDECRSLLKMFMESVSK
jgi:hypothetical protein